MSRSLLCPGAARRCAFLAAVTLCLLLPPLPASAAPPGPPSTKPPPPAELARFVVRGDGTLTLSSIKNNYRFAGRYRDGQGRYRPRALRLINKVFDGDYRRAESRISLRFIELLAHLQRQLEAKEIILSSGYRSPRYNHKLRKAGGVVAKASLHQFGLAADLRLPGVRAIDLWRYVKQHRLGGAGYYRSKWVHVDVGPARYWRQGTANVRSGKSDNNSRLLLVPDYDVYRPGERLRLRLTRMTAYPIGIPPRGFTLEQAEGESWRKVQRFGATTGRKQQGPCPAYNSIAELADLRWRLPASLPPGRYRVSVSFCDRQWEEMPERVSSSPFELVP